VKKLRSTAEFSELGKSKQGTVLLHGGDGHLKTHSNSLLGNTSSNPGPAFAWKGARRAPASGNPAARTAEGFPPAHKGRGIRTAASSATPPAPRWELPAAPTVPKAAQPCPPSRDSPLPSPPARRCNGFLMDDTSGTESFKGRRSAGLSRTLRTWRAFRSRPIPFYLP